MDSNEISVCQQESTRFQPGAPVKAAGGFLLRSEFN
jgi:hypothetical protein